MDAKSIVLRYSPQADPVTGHVEGYKLLEISNELMKEIDQAEQAGQNLSQVGTSLTVKGKPTDDAVICTPSATYQLRTISLSNSLLVLEQPTASSSTSPDKDTSRAPELHLKDTSHEILELLPIVPRLGRIEKVLKEGAWGGMNVLANSGEISEDGKRKREVGEIRNTNGKKRYTRSQLCSVVQASDEELDEGLRDNNVIEIGGHLVYLPLNHLLPLLSILLSLITLHTIDRPERFDYSAEELRDRTFFPLTDPAPIRLTLREDHGLQEEIFDGLTGLFGRVVPVGGAEGKEVWVVDVKRVIREMGKGMLLEENKDEPNTVADFMNRWRMEIGNDFGSAVDLDMLKGYYLVETSRLTALASKDLSASLLTPFPHTSLPSDPATRFSELFLTRPKWRPDDMEPFLRTLVKAGDTKVRDKMVAKFVRIVKEKDGVWWYPRRTA